MRASTGSDAAAWELPAVPASVGPMRRHATAFALAAGASEHTIDAVELAVSETVTNVVIHAYVGRDPGPVGVRCHGDGERMVVEVVDEGVGVAARHDSPGVGHGLALVGALASSLEIGPRSDGPGTVVTMSFAGAAQAPEVRGLEPLCALAVEQRGRRLVPGRRQRRRPAPCHRRGRRRCRADRVAASALPPAKPGTATWAALREGGAQLVVHDPSIARSPGGSGEKLGLAWWVSVPIEGPDGAPMALWGLGGRHGGRPVPAEDVLRALAEAGRTGLAQETERAALRSRLAPTSAP